MDESDSGASCTSAPFYRSVLTTPSGGKVEHCHHHAALSPCGTCWNHWNCGLPLPQVLGYRCSARSLAVNRLITNPSYWLVEYDVNHYNVISVNVNAFQKQNNQNGRGCRTVSAKRSRKFSRIHRQLRHMWTRSQKVEDRSWNNGPGVSSGGKVERHIVLCRLFGSTTSCSLPGLGHSVISRCTPFQLNDVPCRNCKYRLTKNK